MSNNPANEETQNPACAFVRDNAGAFALQALTPTETQQLLDHLADHPECQIFVDEAIATAAVLAFSMPLVAAPDFAVKLKLFDRIAAESNRASKTTTRVQMSNDIVAAYSKSEAATSLPTRPPTSRNWVQYLSAAVVAPLAIALAVVSLWAFNMNDELDSMRDANDDAASNSTSVEMMTMESSDSESSARGSLGTMPDQKSAILLAWDLDPDQEHQVWCEESDGQKTMVTSLDVSDEGNAMQAIEFPGPIDGYKRIFVSGSEAEDSDSPELILTIPEKVGKPDDVTASPTP